MDCPKCGTRNKDEAQTCRMCGTRLKNDVIVSGKVMVCPACRTENSSDRKNCSVCGKRLSVGLEEAEVVREYDWRRPERTYVDYATSSIRTMRAGTGGVLILLAAFATLVDIVITLMVTYDVTQLADYRDLTRTYPALEGAINTVVACQAMRFALVMIAMMSGMLAIRRLRWGMAVAGGVLSVVALMMSVLVFVIPVWLFVAFMIWCGGIVGTILVGISRREFIV